MIKGEIERQRDRDTARKRDMETETEKQRKRKPESQKNEKREAADIAIDAILNDDEIEEAEEAIKLQEAKLRMVYDTDENEWDYSRKRVTDLKGNTRVIFPKPDKDFESQPVKHMLSLYRPIRCVNHFPF